MALLDDDPIWYVSYGSNCMASRFETYLIGGRADGAVRSERGARDRRPPARNEAHWLPFAVRFVGTSAKWGGGGVAFLDHDTEGRAPGRRYLITKGQFDDVIAQESRRASYRLRVDALEPGVVTTIGDRPYDGLVACDPIEGVPAVSFTSPRPLHDRPTTAPAAAYLSTIVRGLCEVHDDDDAMVSALLRAPGVEHGWTASAIRDLLAE